MGVAYARVSSRTVRHRLYGQGDGRTGRTAVCGTRSGPTWIDDEYEGRYIG
eukprot:SAG11_NODE_18031_length_501_cov_31.477612_1_plen_50_part_01